MPVSQACTLRMYHIWYKMINSYHIIITIIMLHDYHQYELGRTQIRELYQGVQVSHAI